MNVVCVDVEALYDDDVYAPVHGEVVQADNGMGTVDTRVVVLVGDVREWTAPPVEHMRARRKQPHEQGQVLIEEHFLEPQGFLEQMELHQLVGFPAPLEFAQGKASCPVLPAFLATTNLKAQFHSRQSHDP
jgi:hypothetical protein